MTAWSSPGSSVDVLCALCRRELAAIESYRQALNSSNLRSYAAPLAICLRSHEQRAEFLKGRIRDLHAEPPNSAGARGAFVKMVEGAAAAIGPKVAIMALEDEEDRDLRNYRAKLMDVDPESQFLLEQQVLPAQLETHRIISNLKLSAEMRAQGA